MSLKSILTVIAVSGVLAWSMPASSHDPENNPGKPVHGGQYVEYEQHYGIEMVVDAGTLVFHITEHLQPYDMSGSTFKVFIQTKAGTQALEAKPDGAKLIADLPSALPTGAKIVLTGKDDDDNPLQARFVAE